MSSLAFHAPDPDFAAKVRASFERQPFMTTIGAALVHVAPGEIDIALPFRDALCQHHGSLHAGAVTTIVDNACGFAAQSLLAAGHDVLTVEFKINFVAPARAPRFVARGRVQRPGRTLTLTTGEVVAIDDDGGERLIAMMQATVMAIATR